jgi:hypothetical protein
MLRDEIENKIQLEKLYKKIIKKEWELNLI